MVQKRVIERKEIKNNSRREEGVLNKKILRLSDPKISSVYKKESFNFLKGKEIKKEIETDDENDSENKLKLKEKKIINHEQSRMKKRKLKDIVSRKSLVQPRSIKLTKLNPVISGDALKIARLMKELLPNTFRLTGVTVKDDTAQVEFATLTEAWQAGSLLKDLTCADLVSRLGAPDLKQKKMGALWNCEFGGEVRSRTSAKSGRVIIRNLRFEVMDENLLKNKFSIFGSIKEVSIPTITDPKTEKLRNKGFAFVQFAKLKNALKMVSEVQKSASLVQNKLKNKKIIHKLKPEEDSLGTILGRPVEVAMSLDKNVYTKSLKPEEEKLTDDFVLRRVRFSFLKELFGSDYIEQLESQNEGAYKQESNLRDRVRREKRSLYRTGSSDEQTIKRMKYESKKDNCIKEEEEESNSDSEF